MALINTPYASLDCSTVRQRLEQVRNDPSQLRQFLSDCFFDGSVAAAESASLFILKHLNTELEALETSDILKSLPTAVPLRNAFALAKVCVFLCLSFQHHKCRSPLRSFCYADNPVKQIAIRSIISSITHTVSEQPHRLAELIERSRTFLTDVLMPGSDIFQRVLLVKGLIGIGMMQGTAFRKKLFTHILAMQPCQTQNVIVTELDPETENDFEMFLISELASMAPDDESFAHIVRRCLIRGLELSDLSALQSLYATRSVKMQSIIPQLGYDAFIFALTSVATVNACEGKLFASGQALSMISDTVQSMVTRSFQLHPETLTLTISACTAIGPMCSAGGAHNLSKCAAVISDGLTSETDSKQRVRQHDFKSKLLKMCGEAEQWNYARSSLWLGLLLKYISLSNQPELLKSWFKDDVLQVIQSIGPGDAETNAKSQPSGPAPELKAFHRKDQFSSNPILLQEHPETRSRNIFPAIALASIAVVGLSHRHSQVRGCAAFALQNMKNRDVLLFFLPSIILRLQEEENGVVATAFLRSLLLSPSLLSDDMTARVAFSAVLKIVRPPVGRNPTAAYHAGLVAFAHAVETAPSMATSIVLAEVLKLQQSFAKITAETKTAACAAILRISKLRPARGTSFVPFISQCISTESMDIAPEAAALSFEAMMVMSQEGVLDPVKAVKIVLKTYPNAGEVNAKARRCYLRLLGSAASATQSKKARDLVQKVIRMLRNCLIYGRKLGGSTASLREQLTWDEMDTAAASLAEYEVNDILRVEYVRDEPLQDAAAEKERLETIEKDCMQFTHSVLSAAVAAQSRGTSDVKGYEALLLVMVREEWANRQRSTFDPERIAKLRATFEDLRRARQSAERSRAKGKGTADATDKDFSSASQFLRAVNSLPAGVIRAVCERCASTCVVVECDIDGKGVIEADSRALAMKAVVKGGALSPALPWTLLIEEALQSNGSGKSEKECALTALSCMGDISYNARNCLTRWFGSTSPLFQRDTSTGETRQLFVGMMLHHPQEIHVQLQRHANSLLPKTVYVLIEATTELEAESEGFRAGVEGLLHFLCTSPDAMETEKLGNDTIRYYTSACLSRCSNTSLENLLQLSKGGTLNTSDTVKARMVSQLGNFSLLRKYVRRLLSTTSSAERDVVEAMGRALSQLASDERNAILFDICDKASSVAHALAVHCLRVGVLLPETKLGLAAAASICSIEERASVSRIVSKLQRALQ